MRICIRVAVELETKCPVCSTEVYSASFVFCPIIAAFCMRRSGPTNTHTEHHLLRWWSVVTVAMVVVDRLDCKKGLIGDVSTTISRITTGTMAFGLPKYRSCALLSMKDSTRTQQESVLCKVIERMTNHVGKHTICWNNLVRLSLSLCCFTLQSFVWLDTNGFSITSVHVY